MVLASKIFGLCQAFFLLTNLSSFNMVEPTFLDQSLPLDSKYGVSLLYSLEFRPPQLTKPQLCKRLPPKFRIWSTDIIFDISIYNKSNIQIQGLLKRHYS